jgi:hypothetical protein
MHVDDVQRTIRPVTQAYRTKALVSRGQDFAVRVHTLGLQPEASTRLRLQLQLDHQVSSWFTDEHIPDCIGRDRVTARHMLRTRGIRTLQSSVLQPTLAVRAVDTGRHMHGMHSLRGYKARIHQRTVIQERVPCKSQRIHTIAKRTYRALHLSGYARIDLRMDAEGRVYVIEANVNNDLTPGEDFPESAQSTGLDYPALLQRVLGAGLAYKPAWKVD